MARPNPKYDEDYPFTSAPTEVTEVPVAPKETRPSPRTENGYGTTQQEAGQTVQTAFSSFTQNLFSGLTFGDPTAGAQNKNTQSATDARNDILPTPANDNVVPLPDPDPAIVVAAEDPTYEVEQTPIVDADYGLPTNGLPETDYGVPNHVDPTLTNGLPLAVRAKEFYDHNKEHLAILIGVVGVVIASGRLKKRGG